MSYELDDDCVREVNFIRSKIGDLLTEHAMDVGISWDSCNLEGPVAVTLAGAPCIPNPENIDTTPSILLWNYPEPDRAGARYATYVAVHEDRQSDRECLEMIITRSSIKIAHNKQPVQATEQILNFIRGVIEKATWEPAYTEAITNPVIRALADSKLQHHRDV